MINVTHNSNYRFLTQESSLKVEGIKHISNHFAKKTKMLINKMKRYVECKKDKKNDNVDVSDKERERFELLERNLGILQSRLNFYEKEKKRTDGQIKALEEKVSIPQFSCISMWHHNYTMCRDFGQMSQMRIFRGVCPYY